MARKWVETLMGDSEAVDDFRAWIDRQQALYTRELDDALNRDDLVGAKAAQAKQKVLDEIAGFVTVSAREDVDYARLRRTRTIKSA